MMSMFKRLLALLFLLSGPAMKGNAEIWHSSFAAKSGRSDFIAAGVRAIQATSNEPTTRHLHRTFTYARGLDLSGSVQGAGGIGGLLALSTQLSTNNPQHYFYHADGSGNVLALVDAAGTVQARYGYEPFGRLFWQSGPLTNLNRLRFASKEMHLSSGLYDFGARWYDPFLQRWLTEDPLGEAGGLNLYRFAANDPLNQVDPWGQLLLFDQQAWGRLLQDLLLGDAGPALDPDSNLALRQAAGVGLSPYTDENGTPVPLGELLATGLGAGVETAALLYTPGGEAAGALAARLSGKVCRALSRTGARAGAEAAETALAAAAKTIPNPAAGEDLFVGLYGQTRRANIQSGLNATHTPHHVVQDAVSGASHSLGVTINLRRDLHELTRSYGRNADLGSNVRNLAADVRDLRNILRDAGYDRSLVNQQMQRLIELNRQVGNVPP
jgi:RHS repeat-associated protein